MVEIVIQGKPYQDRRMKVQCPRCLSQLRFTGSEVTEGVAVSYIVCPVCLPSENGWVDVKFAVPA